MIARGCPSSQERISDFTKSAGPEKILKLCFSVSISSPKTSLSQHLPARVSRPDPACQSRRNGYTDGYKVCQGRRTPNRHRVGKAWDRSFSCFQPAFRLARATSLCECPAIIAPISAGDNRMDERQITVPHKKIDFIPVIPREGCICDAPFGKSATICFAAIVTHGYLTTPPRPLFVAGSLVN